MIAIIIDDLGYALHAGRRVVGLPGPVVVAVLPQTPRGPGLARLANAHGKEVLLHLPLQSVGDTVSDTVSDTVGNTGHNEPGAITLETSRAQLAAVLARNMAAVPFAIGVNGHRGSLLTRHPGHMRWLMEEIDARGMLFVDSYTTPGSVALDMALEAGVPATRRDVFLDTDPAPDSIDREFERLKALARRHGSAVAIGHPYPATLTFLERTLPKLAAQGFRLVGIRELLQSSNDLPSDMAAQGGRAPSGAPAAGQHVSAGGSHAGIRQENEPVRAGPL